MFEATKFAIFAAPRTGSNLLCTILNGHPEILCHHEVYNPHGIFTALDFQPNELNATPLDERDQNPIEFLTRVWKSGAEHGAVGFKWTRGQCTRVLEYVLQNKNIKKIILQRKNRIKTFVSERTRKP